MEVALQKGLLDFVEVPLRVLVSGASRYRFERAASSALRLLGELPARRLHLASARGALLVRFIGEVGAGAGPLAAIARELHARWAALLRR